MDLTENLDQLLVVVLVAAIAPLVAGLIPGRRLPQVVILIVGGMLIGPDLLDLVDPNTPNLVLLSNVGLGFLFLLAGYELELDLFRQDEGKLAFLGWFITAGIAIVVTSALAAIGYVHAFVPVALGLTTTALGTLLPILRENNMLGGRLGTNILAAGAVGEFLPVVGIAIFLSANGKFYGIASLVAMGALAVLVTWAPKLAAGSRVARVIQEGQHATSQTTLRWTIVLLIGLLAIASRVGLDVVLGAFLAGVVLKQWAPGDLRALEGKLDAIGYGFFIPIFFISSGMGLDLDSIAEAPDRLLVFFLLLVAVRGLPSLVIYRNRLSVVERAQMTLLTATALPLLVALAAIGLDSKEMLPENAAALVGAGVLSVMFFPATAVSLQRIAVRRGGGRDAPAPTERSPDSTSSTAAPDADERS
jgi:Kef-type K+ transport system membrane component KefB